MKKYIAFLITPLSALSMLFSVVVPTSVQAQTTPGFCYTFTQNLGEGRALSPANAQALTTALSDAGFWNAATPVTTYNDAVASAVSGFQEKYAAQILTPNGLSYGTGYVGVSTRAELNTLYGCSVPTQSTQSFQCPSGYICTPINPNPAPACPAGWTCVPTTPAGSSTTTSSNPSSVSVNLHLDVSSPLSGQTNQTSSVPVMVFNILAGNGTAYLSSLTTNISTSGTGSVTNAYLYANGTQIGIASVQNGVAQFANISPVAIAQNTEQLFMVEVDTANANGLVVTASINVASANVHDASGSAVNVSGGAYGNPITVTGGNSGSTSADTNSPTAAVTIASGNFGNPTWLPNAQPTGIGPGYSSKDLNGDTGITWPITFTVTSGSSPVYISATPSSAVFFGSSSSGGTPAKTIESITAGPAMPGDTNEGAGANATGSFIVPANSSRTFTVTATLDNSGNTEAATNAVLQFNDVYYSLNPTPAGSVTDASLESSYDYGLGAQSPYVTLSGQVTINSTSGSMGCDTSTTFCVSPAQSRTFSFNLTAGGGGPVNVQSVQSLAPGSQDVLLTSPSGAMPGDTSTAFMIQPSTTRTFKFTITAGVNPVTISSSQSLQLL